jgi:hypothetical protein
MSARLALSTLLAAASLASPAPSRAQGLNVITAVELKDEGSTIVLSVRGSKPPNFTTFSMADPPRFVIDLSESRFDGVPEDIVVQDGIVNVVKNLSYGSDATSIARVMIAFQVEVEPPEVQTAGTTLVVRVTKPGAPAVAGGAQPPGAAAEAAARAEAERQAAAQAQAEAQARAAEQARAQAEAERRAREEMAAQAKAEEDRRTRAEAERQAAAQAQAEAQARAAEQARARAESEQRAREEMSAQAKAEEDRRAQAEAARGEQARLEAEAVAREEAAARARDESDARLAQERARSEAAPAPAQPPAVAAAPAPAPEPAPAAASPRAVEQLGVGAPEAQLREIGFRQMPGASRVFVRTSVTPRFTVQDVGENTIRVEFENTRVARRNDTRFLDTSFFRSAVELITPSRRGSSYVVDIKLRERVPYQQRIEGDMLALDFERPAAPSAAPAPSPGAPAPAEAPPPPPGEAEGGTPEQRY